MEKLTDLSGLQLPLILKIKDLSILLEFTGGSKILCKKISTSVRSELLYTCNNEAL